MRLKHIHIAGFKSFVDPVTLPASAQLTGIVGPNGCGKSNVIDAVRWVLGESKARELRGASMQDVIFNGSIGRKPASRASVELLFDNTEGKAAGQWSQYAEIAVKRVLTRTGDSSYHINNVQVRKRDMADLFLGTGLGGDAYAIIEQGMISRIIEAKPEELRGFLEEAAGVSKYKERRKESESRLRDTRENLERVSDIREELGRQLDKLGVQAEVARCFFLLDEERTLKSQLLALTRKREAQARKIDLSRQMEVARTDIEAKTAELRHLEAELETQRLAQFEATESLNKAQAHFYAESGEVARVEQELRHLHSTRERLANEIRLNQERQTQTQAEQQAAHRDAEQNQLELARAEEQAEILAERAAQAGEAMPEAETAMRETQAAVAAQQREVSQFEQAAQLEDANRIHAEKLIEQLKTRELRLLQEQKNLSENDEAALERQQITLETEQERSERLSEYLETARAELPQHDAQLRQTRQSLDEAKRQLHRLEAETAALLKLQSGVQKAEHQGAAWLVRMGLDSTARLWQEIRVEKGWEMAVEAALGEAMAALAVEAEAAWTHTPPAARFELLLPYQEENRPISPEGFAPALLNLIQTENPLIARFLADRLALAYATDNLQQALQVRAQLSAGAFIATRDGHRVSRDSLIFNAPEKGHQGLLVRAREIERLQEESVWAEGRVEESNDAVQRAETTVQSARRQSEALQSQLSQAQAQIHQLQVSLVRVQEAARRVADRRAQIERELIEIYPQIRGEEESWNAASERNNEALVKIEMARERFETAREARRAADLKLQTQRELQRRVEREAQEAAFQARALATRLQDLTRRSQQAEITRADLSANHERLQNELAQAHEGHSLAELDAALAQRQRAEAELTAVRETLEGANSALRQLDSARLTCEHAFNPLRELALAFELKWKEAEINEARYSEELETVDEAKLDARTQAAGLQGRSEAGLKTELGRLEISINALGPVNMTALDEQKTAQERKQYLDDQTLDLETAVATLEEAIRRIDAETRLRLKDTFDRVSREFKSLFTELFGGGEAQLTLTGEEILDAGLTVLAQPPGKKNSSIHLLSGGEKALTALSLVFAFFRLNPAPFCLLDEVDAPLDDSNTERYCALVTKMSAETQFLFITHNRITMEMAHNLVGITMSEPGVSRPVAVDVEDAIRMSGIG